MNLNENPRDYPTKPLTHTAGNWNVQIRHDENSLFCWDIKLKITNSQQLVALDHQYQAQSHSSTWTTGIFNIRIFFPEEYDTCAPKVTFVTIPFHPNINIETGELHLHLLINWKDDIRVLDIIDCVYVLLN